MKEWKTVLLLWLAAIAYRTLHYFLFTNKIVALSDPMQNILMARRFASGDYYGVLDTYWTPLYAILVGAVSFFVNDLILPAIIVSIIMGSIAAPLTYFLVRQSYGSREAVIAAILAVYYPYLINSVFAIGTENIYLVWIIGAVILGWKGLQENSVTYYLLTGILLGLAYLTRPEAIGYPIFFVLLAVIKNLRQKRLFTRGSMLQVAALVLGFAIFAMPYIFYLHEATGTWTISGKAATNLAVGALQDSSEIGDKPAAVEGSDSKSIKVLLMTFVSSLRDTQTNITNLLYFLLIALIAIGLFRERWSEERFKREAYLISFCLLTILGYAATVSLERYFYVLLPIFFGWIAHGILQFEQWVRETTQKLTPHKSLYLPGSRIFVGLCLIFIFFYVFHVNFYVRSTESAWQGSAFEERDAGLWLKNHSQPSPVIFSASFRPVFYAEGKQFWVENKDISQIIAQIKENKVGYVVDNERSYKKHLHLKGFSEILQNDPAFELVYQKNDQPGYKISIFKLK